VAALGIAGAVAGGAAISWGAVRGLLRRELNVDELVTIAIAAAIYVGEYWGAALVAFMMLFGKVLEDATAARAEHAIEGLGRLVPALARVRDAAAPGGERTVPVEQVQVGEVVVVRPGERLPVDGEVVAGRAAVEEAVITGEPLPVDKAAGDEVFAGTLASGGALEVRAARTGIATALGRIAALVKEAEAERAPIVRTADRWATWFTPTVLALAALVFLWRRELLPAVTVLVVACPCALVLATPTAVVAGIARGALRGILIKGGARLEAAGRVDAVCLDKTGTLTRGRPDVQRVVPLARSREAAGVGEGELLAYAAAAERLSEHPLARAVLAAAHGQGAPLPAPAAGAAAFAAVPGKGVSARIPRTASRGTQDGAPPAGGGPHSDRSHAGGPDQLVEVLVGRPEWLAERGVAWPAEAREAVADLEGLGQTPLAVALDGRPAGVIGVADAPRAEAAAAVQALRAAGLGTIMLLTGDRTAPALAAAQAVGIAPEDVHAGLLPEEKVAWLRRLRGQGHRVAMVGDGVNDAPALAASDVAIAMGAAGTDLAMAAADVVLMTDDLRQAAAAVVLSRATLRTIRQNLVFAALWNVAALAVAAAGGLGPVGGALIHNLGSVAVVVNAARLVGARVEGARG
jgi:Cd2+/Zn2+-exporting ATPase